MLSPRSRFCLPLLQGSRSARWLSPWESLPSPSLFSETLSRPCPLKCCICGQQPLSRLPGTCRTRRCLWAAQRPAMRKPHPPRFPGQVGHTPKAARLPYPQPRAPSHLWNPHFRPGAKRPAIEGHELTASIRVSSSGGKGVTWSSLEKGISGLEPSAHPGDRLGL